MNSSYRKRSDDHIRSAKYRANEAGGCALPLTGWVGELSDLSEAMPEKVADMRQKLHDWYRQVDAEYLQEHKNSGTPWRP